MPEGVFQAALQAETSKIIVVTLALVIIASIPGLLSAVVLLVRSRTKITEQKSKADIDAQQQREAADLEERRQLNEAFRSVIRLVDNKDQQIIQVSQREVELRKAYDEFQRSFLELSDVRTKQLERMTTVVNEQNQTHEVVREAITKAESEIRTHAERSAPAIEIVKELPTTLQRIEETLKQLDAQLKAIPNALKSEIEPLMQTVSNLKTEVKELTDEAKRVTDTILPLITTPHPPIIEAFGGTLTDLGKTQPVDTAGITPGTPPFTDGTIATNGEPIERLPQ